MLIWSVASQKGGVGKTTTVASLAGWMQKEHLKVLVVDTDPHASLTSYLGFEDENLDRTLYDLYASRQLTRDFILNIIIHSNYAGLDLIPASMTLATIDRQLSGRMGVGRIVAAGLELIKDIYDAVIIDCPPVLGALMVNALVASTQVLVPTQTEFLALKGLEGMVRTFHIMNQADPGNGVDYLIVPTMFDRRTKASLQSIEFLRENYQDKIWRGCIPIDTRFRESSARRTPLPIMESTSRGAMAYRQLLEDMIAGELQNNPHLVTPACAAILRKDGGAHVAKPSAPALGGQSASHIRDSLVSMMGAVTDPPVQQAAVQAAPTANAPAAAAAPAGPADRFSEAARAPEAGRQPVVNTNTQQTTVAQVSSPAGQTAAAKAVATSPAAATVVTPPPASAPTSAASVSAASSPNIPQAHMQTTAGSPAARKSAASPQPGTPVAPVASSAPQTTVPSHAVPDKGEA